MSNTPPPFTDPSMNPKAAAKAAKAYAKATRPWYQKKRFIIPLAFVALAVIGSALGGGEDADPAVAADTVKVDKTEGTKPNKDVAAKDKKTEAPEPAAPKLTSQQENAVRSAENYLSFSGFSRAGLIQQLSSDFGDGYDKKDATVAVDSLDVDWNAEAVESAKNYLDLSGFSCDGLIQQLSSSAGDKYTTKQAEHGAKKAGAC
jgi:hypothetical protein